MDKETYILDGYKDERGSNVPNYTVSSDKKLDSKGAFFDICEIGDAMKMQPAFNVGLHCHDYYTLFIIKGKGTHQIDMHAEKFSSLSVFFISPGQPHMVKYDELDYGYAIAFSSSFLDNMSANMMFHIKNNVFNTLSGSIVCNINDEKEKFLIEDIKQLHSSFLLSAKSFGYATRLASLLTVLMVNLQEYGEWHGQIDRSSNANEYEKYIKFVELVNNRFMDVHNIKEYAQLLGISVSALNKCVQKVSGSTPLQIVQQRTVAEAKRLLISDKNMRIKEITDQLGFKDPSHFVKFFKKYTNITPLEYRQMSI